MPTINILPKNLANQIAAGEVVERPVSIVKELLENSLDAQAKNITIKLLQGGKEKIEIIDDGYGMSPEDARLSLHRFATSKITTQDDLFAIHTFGFRGEALPSIASVSLFTLQTKHKESNEGLEIHIRGGEKESEKFIGMNVGTRIVVEQLFFNIPARKKYLKADSTEVSHILQYVTDTALAHPEVGFTLEHNGKKMLHVLATQGVYGRIVQLFGQEAANSMIFCEMSSPDLQISGFISHPDIRKTNAQYEFLYVNKRSIKDRMIHKAVMDGYDRLLERGTFPFVVLFLNIEPQKVDVNVHPRKLEVRFENSQLVFQSVVKTLKQTLENYYSASENKLSSDIEQAGEYKEQNFPKQNHFSSWEKSPRSPYAAFKYAKYEDPSRVSLFAQDHSESSYFSEIYKREPQNFLENNEQILIDKPTEDFHDSQNRKYRLLGQMHRSYLIIENSEGVLFVDQHAAHEIVLFQRIKDRYANKNFEIQKLITPLQISLDAQQFLAWESNQDIFQQFGFEIEPMGKQSIGIFTIPLLLQEKNITEIIRELIAECQETGKKYIQERLEKIYATMACRAAVKFGDILTFEEQEKLLQDLFALPAGYSCPHGRPVMKLFTLQEMLKWFERS